MPKLTTMASAHSFAHLLGFGATKATKKRAEDDLDEEKGDGDDEDDNKKAKRAESPEKEEESDETEERDEEEDDGKKSKKAKSKRAKADDDGDDGESGEDDDEEEGDDDSDGADMRKKSARPARLRERARCAAIFADASAGKNPALAATLAFQTDMPRSQAVKVLRAGGAAIPTSRRVSLDDRMANVRTPTVGAGDVARPARGGAHDMAAQIVAAGKKRRGEA